MRTHKQTHKQIRSKKHNTHIKHRQQSEVQHETQTLTPQHTHTQQHRQSSILATW